METGAWEDPLHDHGLWQDRDIRQNSHMALLTIHDVAQWLTIKPATLYAWVVQGKIPALKIHGIIRFRRDELEAWIEVFRTETPEPPPPSVRRPRSSDINAIIATAKAGVYTRDRGKPDQQDRATRKGDSHGSV